MYLFTSSYIFNNPLKMFATYLLCLCFRRQWCDQVDGGIFVFPVLPRALGVLSQHRVHIAREDCCDRALKKLTEAPHQVTCGPTTSVNVWGKMRERVNSGDMVIIGAFSSVSYLRVNFWVQNKPTTNKITMHLGFDGSYMPGDPSQNNS